ncbi:carbohydrate ABC transporter permease [Microbacterium sp. MYb66]|jgi:multiple sugar transport system permease protein|uniref:carbohydrate ABC transporter permease n=1 Tax=Microbacterium sp. MYb66 TaxID=1848692 RepID=UPI000D004400|nr:sugar ABC transporter permease [Microbacterium sp. MYb66]PRA78845.1 ABC transporter permease [Microbacterium sp. MYb66]
MTAVASTTSIATPRRRSFRSWVTGGGLTKIAFALPLLFIFGYFSWGPIVDGIVMSVQNTNLVDDPEFVGWSNFEYVLTDPLLPKALVNTLYYAFLALIFGFPVPLLLATFMAELRGTRRLYSVLAYLPVIVPPVVSVLLWKFFYSPEPTGLFNTVLGWIGAGPFAWLNSADMVMPAIVLESTWAYSGSTVIIYLAALTAVQRELYEAAELDGAGIVRRTWHITIPQIRGVLLIMLILQIINTMQVFTEPFIFTGGGPNNASTTLLLMIYNYAFLDGDFGAATALSVLLAAFLGLLSAGYFAATRRLN